MVKKSSKYHQIIETARALFWKHGISRISVEEICQKADVSKMTFYRKFDNKTELAKTVLTNVFETSMQQYEHIMDQPQVPFQEKVAQVLILKFENSKEISQELIMDIYHNQEAELMDFINTWKKQSLDRFLSDMMHAQEKGWVRKDLKPAFILYFLNKAQEMVTDEHLLAMYDSSQQLIMEVTHFFFYGVSSRN